MTCNLRKRLKEAGKPCPTEKWNEDGTVTVDGDSYLALLKLRKLVAEIDTALWKLEELEKRDAEFVTIPRLKDNGSVE